MTCVGMVTVWSASGMLSVGTIGITSVYSSRLLYVAGESTPLEASGVARLDFDAGKLPGHLRVGNSSQSPWFGVALPQVTPGSPVPGSPLVQV